MFAVLVYILQSLLPSVVAILVLSYSGMAGVLVCIRKSLLPSVESAAAAGSPSAAVVQKLAHSSAADIPAAAAPSAADSARSSQRSQSDPAPGPSLSASQLF